MLRGEAVPIGPVEVPERELDAGLGTIAVRLECPEDGSYAVTLACGERICVFGCFEEAVAV